MCLDVGFQQDCLKCIIKLKVTDFQQYVTVNLETNIFQTPFGTGFEEVV